MAHITDVACAYVDPFTCMCVGLHASPCLFGQRRLVKSFTKLVVNLGTAFSLSGAERRHMLLEYHLSSPVAAPAIRVDCTQMQALICLASDIEPPIAGSSTQHLQPIHAAFTATWLRMEAFPATVSSDHAHQVIPHTSHPSLARIMFATQHCATETTAVSPGLFHLSFGG